MKVAFKFAAVAILSASAFASAHAADYTMRLSHQLPASHHVAKALEQFAEDVKTNTSGQVEVQLFGGEQLFKGTQNHAAVARGQVEAASVVSLLWGGTVPEVQVFSIPYLMTSREKINNFYGSDAAKLLNEKLQQKGVTNIAWLLDANNATFTSQKHPLIAPEDFKGVKIRGLSRLSDVGFIALGAAPSTMPGSEVYQGLQTGVIDAGVSSASAVYARRYYEVQKYAVATPLLTVFQNLIVNPRWWASLPADVQAGVAKAAQSAEQTLLPKSDAVDPEGVAKLETVGMVVTVHTPEQIQALERVMQPPVIEEFQKTTADGQKLIEMIKQL
ncbi:TRAP transporter substrate-binding protein DctP [Pseudomonas sp. MMS21-TM103]|uniref:TRAP transporter substrate-binding protein DctP n=1 Tax=Pseudomonas sp. MMS21 TM103 TaxID=2886506 RepID=UPI001EDE2E0E|nr:TRAP transporter substrate-binding protein DctP [Pseudomonas sp. MMS21 TM103]MCG4454895.1 TRAP transporter substrate-binding protein DctP [Pseudomonas sp. MMS21 TM103]